MATPTREIFRVNPVDIDENAAIGIDLPLVKPNGAPFPQTYLTIDAAKANLKNLILTRKGERPFQPWFGTSIYDFIFDNNVPEMLLKMETDINEAIEHWLPYLDIKQLDIRVADTAYGFSDNFNGVQIQIDFSLKGNRFSEESIVVVIGTE
jgi:phage baseplate assembly protein W